MNRFQLTDEEDARLWFEKGRRGYDVYFEDEIRCGEYRNPVRCGEYRHMEKRIIGKERWKQRILNLGPIMYKEMRGLI